MKRQFLFFILIVCLILFIGCASTNEEIDEILKIEREETYPEVPLDLEIVYSKLEDLIDDADSILRVKVTDHKASIVPKNPPLKKTKVKINYVYKGDAIKKDIMRVYEVDGLNDTVLGGIPYMKMGEEYFLFLKKSKNRWYVCGAFQGRFIIRENYVFQQATEDYKLKGYKPLTVENFSDFIENYLKEKEEVID